MSKLQYPNSHFGIWFITNKIIKIFSISLPELKTLQPLTHHNFESKVLHSFPKLVDGWVSSSFFFFEGWTEIESVNNSSINLFQQKLSWSYFLMWDSTFQNPFKHNFYKKYILTYNFKVKFCHLETKIKSLRDHLFLNYSQESNTL